MTGVSMTEAWVLEALADAMAKLPEVQWDRTAGVEHARVVFGWLRRRDGDRDFVLLEARTEWGDQVAIVTSSAKYSLDFDVRLGGDPDRHEPCQRVGDVFEELPP